MWISSEDLAYRPGLSRYLRAFLVQTVEEAANKKEAKKHLLDQKKVLTEFIKINDDASPYADVPEFERSIITDITTFMNSKQTDEVHRKLKELAGTIQARENDFSRIRDTNRWSVPLAIVGIVLTFIFGIATIYKW